MTAVARAPGFGETVGTLVRNDLFDRELVLRSEAGGRAPLAVGPHALAQRELMGDATLSENFDSLAPGH